jgi:hypothetical protein
VTFIPAGMKRLLHGILLYGLKHVYGKGDVCTVKSVLFSSYFWGQSVTFARQRHIAQLVALLANHCEYFYFILVLSHEMHNATAGKQTVCVT